MSSARLDERGELLRAAEQTRAEEIEQRPEVGQSILDGRAGQGQPAAGAQFLDRACLAGARVLDGLGFVEDGQVPFRGFQPGEPRDHRVTRDRQVVIGQPARRVPCDLRQGFSRCLGRMRVEDAQRRGEPLQFAFPVGDQRGGHDQDARLGWVAVARGCGVLSAFEDEQQGNDLDGLAQSHVVGQTGAQPESGHEP